MLLAYVDVYPYNFGNVEDQHNTENSQTSLSTVASKELQGLRDSVTVIARTKE